MSNFKKNLITAAFLAVLTLSASVFTASNFPVSVAVAQTTGGSTGGPQDGGDGKKKKCRPPQQCVPINQNSSGQGEIETTELKTVNETKSSGWWGDFINWLFGE